MKIVIYQSETKEALLDTAMRGLHKLTEKQLAYVIGMEQAEELKAEEGKNEAVIKANESQQG